MHDNSVPFKSVFNRKPYQKIFQNVSCVKSCGLAASSLAFLFFIFCRVANVSTCTSYMLLLKGKCETVTFVVKHASAIIGGALLEMIDTIN